MKLLVISIFLTACAYGEPLPTQRTEPKATEPVPAQPPVESGGWLCVVPNGTFSCDAENKFIYCQCPQSCVEIIDPATGAGLVGKCVGS